MLGLTAGIVIARLRTLSFITLSFKTLISLWRTFTTCSTCRWYFGFFAGWYYLFPRITSYAYSDALGRIHFWLLFIGVNTALVPQVLLASGLAGRVVNAPDWFRHSNLVSWIGSYICAAGILVFVVNMALSFLRRQRAD